MFRRRRAAGEISAVGFISDPFENGFDLGADFLEGKVLPGVAALTAK